MASLACQYPSEVLGLLFAEPMIWVRRGTTWKSILELRDTSTTSPKTQMEFAAWKGTLWRHRQSVPQLAV
jgi:hypothetical protein